MYLVKPNASNPYYRGRYTLGRNPREYEVSTRTKNREVARERLKRIVAEHEREDVGLIAPKAVREAQQRPVLDIFAEFIEDLRSQGLKNDYIRHVKNRFPKLVKACGWKHLADMTPKSIQDWRKANPKYRARTINHFYDAANRFRNWVKRTYDIPNPIEGVGKVKVSARYPDGPRAFSNEELTRLFVVAQNWRLLYRLLAFTGLRRQEARDLQWGDVVLDENPRLQLREDATKSERADTLPLPPELARDLAATRPCYWKPTDRVFREGVARNPKLKKDLQAAGIELVDRYGRPLGFHTFRRSYITMMHNLGVPPRAVMQLARHKNPNLTNWTYTDTTKLDLHSHVARLENSIIKGPDSAPPVRPDPNHPPKAAPESSPPLSPGPTGNPCLSVDTNGYDRESRKITSSAEAAVFEEDRPPLGTNGHAGPNGKLAEREGFEPPVDFRPHSISNAAHSATLSPLPVRQAHAAKAA